MSNSSTVLGTDNLAFVELLYSRFLEDPNSVPEDFRLYFESEHPATNGSVRLGPSFTASSLFDPTGSSSIHVAVPRGASVPNSPAANSPAAHSPAANGSNGAAAHANGVTARAATNGSNGSHSQNGALENGTRQAL